MFEPKRYEATEGWRKMMVIIIIIIIIIIKLNCRWTFTLWQWYYNKTQHKNHISQKIYHAQTKHCNQSYTSNKGHITHTQKK
jgi:hypothetical protein